MVLLEGGITPSKLIWSYYFEIHTQSSEWCAVKLCGLGQEVTQAVTLSRPRTHGEPHHGACTSLHRQCPRCLSLGQMEAETLWSDKWQVCQVVCCLPLHVDIPLTKALGLDTEPALRQPDQRGQHLRPPQTVLLRQERIVWLFRVIIPITLLTISQLCL